MRQVPYKGLWYIKRREEGWRWREIAAEAGIYLENAHAAAKTARAFLAAARAEDPTISIERLIAREQARDMVSDYNKFLRAGASIDDLTPKVIESIRAFQAYGSVECAAVALNVNVKTLRARLRRAQDEFRACSLGFIRDLDTGDDPK